MKFLKTLKESQNINKFIEEIRVKIGDEILEIPPSRIFFNEGEDKNTLKITITDDSVRIEQHKIEGMLNLFGAEKWDIQADFVNEQIIIYLW